MPIIGSLSSAVAASGLPLERGEIWGLYGKMLRASTFSGYFYAKIRLSAIILDGKNKIIWGDIFCVIVLLETPFSNMLLVYSTMILLAL
jgi:hypothetical protein